jgi:hypothetical protein
MKPYHDKILHKKKAGGVAQGVGPEFKPQCHKKEEEEEEKEEEEEEFKSALS